MDIYETWYIKKEGVIQMKDDVKQMTDQEVFNILKQAGESYSNYLKLTDNLTSNSCYTTYDNYNRNINHPLSLVIKE